MTRHELSSEKSTNVRFNPVLTGPNSGPIAMPGSARAALRGLSLLAPGPAGALAETLFLKSFRFPVPNRELWWATDAEEIRLPGPDGKELVGWMWGWSGPTVLLVHGWAGRGLQMGAFAAPLVEAGFRVVAFDAPGHGRSPGSASSLPAFVDAIVRVSEHLGNVYAVVAHSFGAAATTVALGTEDYDRDWMPERLVYVAPASSFDTVTDGFSHKTGFTRRVVRRVRDRLERRFGFRWEEVQPHALAPHRRERLLVLHDAHDEELPVDDSRRMTASWPGAELRVSEGLGHYRILREARVVEQAVAFLTEDPEEG